ncbi:MAG: sialidase family protein, partial [Rhodothermales bacterium]
MKRFVLVVSFLAISVVALLMVEPFSSSEPSSSHRGSVYPSEAMEGTEDNPLARVEYEWRRLRDPATNRIPPGIAHRELEFVHRMEQQADLHSITQSSDWVSRGPYNFGGRTKALAIDVANENHILAGDITSGMFKSADGGASWYKTTAPDQLHSVTTVVQNTAPGKQNIWYYGTGDRSPGSLAGTIKFPNGMSNSVYRGDGIFKSVDGGDTWTQLPSTVSHSPAETNVFDFISGLATFGEDGVLAATVNGVYMSTDGGTSWTESLGIGGLEAYQFEEYPTSEVAVGGDGTFYATVGGSGPYAGVYRSTDEGESWETITPTDWPAATERTVIAVAPSNDHLVYFVTGVANIQVELRKYESGSGWTNLTSGLPNGGQLVTYGSYMLTLSVKPDDQNTLFLGTVGFYRSIDGGASFEQIGESPNFHPDQNATAFYPSNPDRMIVGNDGGLYRVENNKAPAVNNGLDWEPLNNGYLTTQFYTVAVDHGTPGSEELTGGMQDNGVAHTSSSDPGVPWQGVAGFDGGGVAITDGGQYVYGATGATFRIFRKAPPYDGTQAAEVTPAGGRLGLFLVLFQLDPFDQKIMYLPSQKTLWRNSDLTAIPYVFNGGPTDINWDTFENVKGHYIHAIAMSAAEPRRLFYSGSDTSAFVDERVFYLDNPQVGQPVPVDITSEGFPYYPYVPDIACIAVDPRDSNKLAVVFPSYGVLSIYYTDDLGETWTPVSGNLEENPDGSGSGPSVRWLTILYVQDQPIYLAGTSVGLFATAKLDGMNTKWSPEAMDTIGNIVISMIDVRQSDGFVAVATYGNGIYTTHITKVTIGVEDQIELPEAFEIASAYPNPFATSTTIAYDLPRAGAVS